MFQPLLNQLQNADPAQRRQAVTALGTIRHPRARQALRYGQQRTANAAAFLFLLMLAALLILWLTRAYLFTHHVLIR